MNSELKNYCKDEFFHASSLTEQQSLYPRSDISDIQEAEYIHLLYLLKTSGKTKDIKKIKPEYICVAFILFLIILSCFI